MYVLFLNMYMEICSWFEQKGESNINTQSLCLMEVIQIHCNFTSFLGLYIYIYIYIERERERERERIK